MTNDIILKGASESTTYSRKRGEYHNMSIGKRLAKLRGDRSQETVARDLGISLSAYTKYEQDIRVPRDELKVRIAKYYDVSVESIFFA